MDKWEAYWRGLLDSIAIFAGHVQSGPPRDDADILATIGPANEGRCLSADERAVVVEKMIEEGKL